MVDKISSGLHGVEDSKVARTYTTNFSQLRQVKKLTRINNKIAAKAVKKSKFDAVPPQERLLPSQQKRLVKTFKTLEQGEKLQNTELNRRDVKRLSRFGLFKSYFRSRPSATIETANRLSGREREEMAAQSAEEEAQQAQRLQARVRHDRLAAEREEEAAKHARPMTHAGLQPVTASAVGHPVNNQPRIGVTDRGQGHGPSSSIFKVMEGGKSHETETSAPPQVAILPAESYDDASSDTDLPMAA